MLHYDRKKIGQFLKRAREKAGFTQVQVAEKMGYTSPQFISNIERGASVAPLKLLSELMSLYKANPEPLIRLMVRSHAEILRNKLIPRKAGNKR